MRVSGHVPKSSAWQAGSRATVATKAGTCGPASRAAPPATTMTTTSGSPPLPLAPPPTALQRPNSELDLTGHQSVPSLPAVFMSSGAGGEAGRNGGGRGPGQKGGGGERVFISRLVLA